MSQAQSLDSRAPLGPELALDGPSEQTHLAAQRPSDLSPWIWGPLSVAVFLLLGTATWARPWLIRSWLRKDLDGGGLIEILTPLAMIPGILAGTLVLLHQARLRLALKPRIFVLLITLGTLYFAGEEVSWGQWLFGWATPASWAEINRQAETNLHNVSSLFNQKPRTLLELWVFIGLLAAVSMRQHRRREPSSGDLEAWILPTPASLGAGSLALVPRVLQPIEEFFDPAEIRWLVDPEVQEYHLGLYLTFYLTSLHKRMQALAR